MIRRYLLILLHFYVQIQADLNVCEVAQNCGECIQSVGCVWCTEPDFKDLPSIYCKNENSNISQWCTPDKLISPSTVYHVQKNEDLQSDRDRIPVQVKPQRIKLSIRKGENFALNFQYRQAENYPVDLYYIMDLSASMENHREKLAKLGGNLAEVMRNITSNFRLGFGSFVDKTASPFISIVPSALKSPCSIKGIPCVPPYSYKNHMSLTDNFQLFSEEVNKARVSGNLDSPEGGFDAIMQAMVCHEIIGWREQARHIIVLSTDAEFHIAGDGKLAGIVEPNDGKCHMNDSMYTHSTVYDYPSISQINHVAKLNNVNLIFAIVKTEGKPGVYESYNALHHRIANSAIGALTQDSSNVVSLVVDNYQKIVDSVTIKDDANSDIDIKYFPHCRHPKETGCNNVHAGEIINFTAIIRPLSCPKEGITSQIIKIKPEGLNEGLILELEVLCRCPCENSSHPDFKFAASKCNQKGDLGCGICNCHPGYFGRNCECDRAITSSDDISGCKRHPNDTEICSGLGNCMCGRCQCAVRPGNDVIYGKFCECDNYSCIRSNGLICSGPERGVCDCGVCSCKAGWTGAACNCANTSTSCVSPDGDGTVCSGRGSCICGECQCDLIDNYRYSGKYCDECPSCPGQRCEELYHCVQCQAYKTGKFNENECVTECSTIITSMVDIVEEKEEANQKICRAPDSSGCTILYQYSYGDDGNFIVEVQKERVCPEKANILAVALGLIGTTLLAGIVLLIIWKVFTIFHDRREYARFESEKASAKWSKYDNPLYKGATSEFRNPIYQQ